MPQNLHDNMRVVRNMKSAIAVSNACTMDCTASTPMNITVPVTHTDIRIANVSVIVDDRRRSDISHIWDATY